MKLLYIILATATFFSIATKETAPTETYIHLAYNEGIKDGQEGLLISVINGEVRP